MAYDNVLLINRDDLIKYTSMSGNVDTSKILPHVQTAQDIQLQPVLGTKLYERCKQIIDEDQLDNPLYTAYRTLIITYITPFLVFASMVDFLPFHNYRITNGGVDRHDPENGIPADAAEVDKLTYQFRGRSKTYLSLLKDYLCENSTDYPEYYTNTGADVNPGGGNSTAGGWHLD